VMLEIIVSTFEEYLESEIGRSMHEERVRSQRSHPEYNGHLATNTRYFMQYLLGLCRGAGMPEITNVPIKLWARYMPETIELLIRRLCLPDRLFFGTGPEPMSVVKLGKPEWHAGTSDAKATNSSDIQTRIQKTFDVKPVVDPA